MDDDLAKVWQRKLPFGDHHFHVTGDEFARCISRDLVYKFSLYFCKFEVNKDVLY